MLNMRMTPLRRAGPRPIDLVVNYSDKTEDGVENFPTLTLDVQDYNLGLEHRSQSLLKIECWMT